MNALLGDAGGTVVMSASSSTHVVSVASVAHPHSDVSCREGTGQSNQGILLWPLIALLSVAGFIGESPQLAKLWEIWTTDPLRSIGMLILPASIFLILRVWRRSGWEHEGTWWGLALVALAYAPLIYSERLVLFWTAGNIRINFLPSVLPIYLYASGVVLLFGGMRVWRRAWFPLALLLFLQPVPDVVVQYLDIPMQGFAARVARSFADLLGFSPSNGELLRLMFTPSFGMFIAPGCDGMRGAITLGYGALIAGYVKGVSALRWTGYVIGGVLLGHIFNLFRLCALVLYYRIAVGHPALEGWARQADYAIGAMLFLVAAFLLLWILLRKQRQENEIGAVLPLGVRQGAKRGSIYWKMAVLAVVVVRVLVPGLRAARKNPENLALALQRGAITAREIDQRLPAQVGAYKLVRAWQEDDQGVSVLEAAVFEADPSDEMEIGIWLPPSGHSIERSLMTQGKYPVAGAVTDFMTANGHKVPFNTALYDDGKTNMFIGDTYCTPLSCQASAGREQGLHLTLAEVTGSSAPGKRAVPIFFKIQVPRIDAPRDVVFGSLRAKSQKFLAQLTLTRLSQDFQ
jgi:exosortase J